MKQSYTIVYYTADTESAAMLWDIFITLLYNNYNVIKCHGFIQGIFFTLKLGPEKGVTHIALAAVINALWDLWSKMEGKVSYQHNVMSMPPFLILRWETTSMLHIGSHNNLSNCVSCNET